jgi:hypothetical protein
VGNPYPSTIDWNAASGWTKTGITNTIYMTDNGGYTGGPTRYATFNGTVGTNGGSRYIPMGQAFFIKSNGGPINFRSTEAVKAPGAATTFFREAEPENVLRIALRQGDMTDETVIHYRKDATASFDADMDAYKMANDVMNLSSMLQDGAQLAINSVPASAADACGSVIKLNVTDVEPGSYDLYFSNLESFTDKMYITLHDAFLGKSVRVNNTTAYTFEVVADSASIGAERFSLIMSAKPVPDLSDIASSTTCPGQNGKISIPASAKGYTYVVQSGQDTLATAFGSGTLLEITVAGDKLAKGVNSFAVTAKDPGCANLSNQVIATVVVTDVTPAQILLTEGDQLVSNYSTGNTWYLDDELMNNDVQIITADRSGTYKLAVQTQGCRLETSTAFIVSKGERGYSVYPNPVRRSKDLLTIETSSHSGESVAILGTTGEEIGQLALEKTATETYVGTFDFTTLPAGIYFVRLRDGKKYKLVKLLIF